METVRITQPDLQKRGALEKMRNRLVYTAFGFGLLFLAVIGKLADATILQPLAPHRPERPIQALFTAPKTPETRLPGQRAMITDRNGQILAISLPTVAVFADPRQIIDPADAAHRLKQVLPRLDETAAQTRLADTNRQFVYLERQITPREQLAINSLGIPGIDFRPTEQRHYPMGRTAAQVLGGTDVDEHGVAGVEKHFDQRLFDDNSPLRLSLDVRVQAVVRDELSKAIDFFQAIGGCGIVMDVTTGEVLAMVSLPDYDANNFGSAPADDRFNRAVTGIQSRAARSSCRRHRWRWIPASCTSGTSSMRRIRSISAASPSPTSRASTASCTCRRCWRIPPTSERRTSRIPWAASASARG
jgi:cell division protein FtsI (penicillin-binding protein 3)